MSITPVLPLLEASSLNVDIAGNSVCQDLNLSVLPGETWGILGVNGVGKTTLLHTLGGLRAADKGEIIYEGNPIETLTTRERAKHRAILFQDKTDPFPATVIESVLIGRHPHIDKWQWESDKDINIAKQAMEQFELTGKENQLVNTLSGGERQRVAIATLLSQQTKLLLLDEPGNHLDLKNQMKTMEVFSQLVKQTSIAAVMILHDLNMAARFCNNVLMLLGDGKTVQGKSEELLNPEMLQELYGYPIEKIQHAGNAVFVPV